MMSAVRFQRGSSGARVARQVWLEQGTHNCKRAFSLVFTGPETVFVEGNPLQTRFPFARGLRGFPAKNGPTVERTVEKGRFHRRDKKFRNQGDRASRFRRRLSAIAMARLEGQPGVAKGLRISVGSLLKRARTLRREAERLVRQLGRTSEQITALITPSDSGNQKSGPPQKQRLW